jgi:hypothetical protein
MTLAELVERLGYAESENYLRKDRGDFNRVVDYGHLFRRATKDPCRLTGVYALRQSETSAIPVVYVCDTDSESEAREVHRLVWNQDMVPFLIVNSPESVRVYPGFSRQRESTWSREIDVVEQAFAAADLERIAETLSANAVDAGDSWRVWGQHIRPEYRVDWGLLDNLRKLDAWLQGQAGLGREISHALIGKYVYLHYLRDRGILSSRKLERWQIPSDIVFGRHATRDGLNAIQEKLDVWLNGEIFPINFRQQGAPRDEHISRVAATFCGDEPLGPEQWQLHLDFKAYNFSYIPIEVLSTIYEQFLHAPEKDGTKSRGRSVGAYYTPIPVVNLMLSELEQRYPLRKGMRVFDPACGSGAFLVQAFRRLVEKEHPPSGDQPTPSDLRRLLEDHFFGIDTDIDACGVTRLSLVLTLLDYVYPPDLEMDGRPGRKPLLPDLRENIREANFFSDGKWQRVFADKKADWVVGNPPWKQLKIRRAKEKNGSIPVRKEDEPVFAWMKAQQKRRPVGNRQVARAFAWRVAEYVDDDGEVALFLPAMTLFEEAARTFRARFLRDMSVHTIVNFSNLRWVISGGRFTAPAAAFFYRPRSQQNEGYGEDETIRTYSPLVANQEATKTVVDGRRNESWSVVINASEIRDVVLDCVADGQGLPWKTAFWGSTLSTKLLRLLKRRFRSVGEMEDRGMLIMSGGLQLRRKDAAEALEPVSLPENRKTVDVRILKGMRDFFALPDQAMIAVPEDLTHVRKGRGSLPLSVCHPPHILVSAARNFAVYSEQFFLVSGSRQIGIASPTQNEQLLKALSLFLSSDFAFYCEFFLSTELGVERDRSTLKALRQVPCPLAEMPRNELGIWAKLYDKLAEATQEVYRRGRLWQNVNWQSLRGLTSVVSNDLTNELNSLVYDALRLSREERSLVRDLVRVRLALNDGQLGHEAVRRPTKPEMRSYGVALQAELDDYVRGELPGKHDVQIVYDDLSGMVCVRLVRNGTAASHVSLMRADDSEATALERCRQRIRQKRSQWVYFDRNLRIYDDSHTYVLKPMQRFHWTETQARVDAMDIISESISRREET